MKGVIAKPEYWRDLAAKARRQAAAIGDSRARHMLSQIADSYDALAEQAAEHARRDRLIDGAE